MQQCTVFTYTLEGLEDDDYPPAVYAGQLTQEQIEQLTAEPAYPRRALMVRHEGGAPVAFSVSYSNDAEAEPEPCDGWAGARFTEDTGRGHLAVIVRYLPLLRRA